MSWEVFSVDCKFGFSGILVDFEFLIVESGFLPLTFLFGSFLFLFDTVALPGFLETGLFDSSQTPVSFS
jgi:hypothetical protein